jgi:hypothetical protein
MARFDGQGTQTALRTARGQGISRPPPGALQPDQAHRTVHLGLASPASRCTRTIRRCTSFSPSACNRSTPATGHYAWVHATVYRKAFSPGPSRLTKLHPAWVSQLLTTRHMFHIAVAPSQLTKLQLLGFAIAYLQAHNNYALAAHNNRPSNCHRSPPATGQFLLGFCNC